MSKVVICNELFDFIHNPLVSLSICRAYREKISECSEKLISQGILLIIFLPSNCQVESQISNVLSGLCCVRVIMLPNEIGVTEVFSLLFSQTDLADRFTKSNALDVVASVIPGSVPPLDVFAIVNPCHRRFLGNSGSLNSRLNTICGGRLRDLCRQLHGGEAEPGKAYLTPVADWMISPHIAIKNILNVCDADCCSSSDEIEISKCISNIFDSILVTPPQIQRPMDVYGLIALEKFLLSSSTVFSGPGVKPPKACPSQAYLNRHFKQLEGGQPWEIVLIKYLEVAELSELRSLSGNDLAIMKFIFYIDPQKRFLVMHDGYPKSAFHLLVVPFPSFLNILSLWQFDGIKLADPIQTDALMPKISLLQKVADLCQRAVSRQLFYQKFPHKRRDAESQALSDFPIDGVSSGYHSIPSLKPVHIHVISHDFKSACLKTEKHYNSYTTDFFLPLSVVESRLTTSSPLMDKTQEQYEAFLSLPLICRKCSGVVSFPSMKKLVTHLNSNH